MHFLFPLVSLLAGISTAAPLNEDTEMMPRTFVDPELGNVTIIASGVVHDNEENVALAKRQNLCSSREIPDECCFDTRTVGWGWHQVTVNDGTSPNACIGYTVWPQEKCDKKWTDGDYDDIVALCHELQPKKGLLRTASGRWWNGNYRDWSKGAEGIDRYCGFLHLTLKTNRVLDSIGGPHKIYWNKDNSWMQFNHKSKLIGGVTCAKD